MSDLPPRARLPLLALGFVALLLGVFSGLARLGLALDAAAASLAAYHGPLMVAGFFGVVIALERAVATGHLWAYVAPLACGLSGIALFAGEPGAAAALQAAGAAILVVASLRFVAIQPALHTATVAAGAVALLAANLAWLATGVPSLAVPGWAAFLVLTIAGERLELTRLLPRSPAAQALFLLIVATIAGGAASAHSAAGARVLGVALLALAAWLGVVRPRPPHGPRPRADALHGGVPAVGLRLARGRRRDDRGGGARPGHPGVRRGAARAVRRLRVRDGVRPRADHPAGGAAREAAVRAGVLPAARAAARRASRCGSPATRSDPCAVVRAGGVANAVALGVFIVTAATAVAARAACGAPRRTRLTLAPGAGARRYPCSDSYFAISSSGDSTKSGFGHDAVGRADELALRLVLGADALGAAQGVDHVGGVADADRLVGTHRLAGVAGGAVVVDE